jgi:hypothetical protein
MNRFTMQIPIIKSDWVRVPNKLNKFIKTYEIIIDTSATIDSIEENLTNDTAIINCSGAQ